MYEVQIDVVFTLREWRENKLSGRERTILYYPTSLTIDSSTSLLFFSFPSLLFLSKKHNFKVCFSIILVAFSTPFLHV